MPENRGEVGHRWIQDVKANGRLQAFLNCMAFFGKMHSKRKVLEKRPTKTGDDKGITRLPLRNYSELMLDPD